MFQPLRKRVKFAACAFGLSVIASCASVEFSLDTATSGTFTSSGISLTLLSIDLPNGALNIARENASDARQPNTEIIDATVWPYLGWFDWLLDIAGVRYAKVSGTWGFPPD